MAAIMIMITAQRLHFLEETVKHEVKEEEKKEPDKNKASFVTFWKTFTNLYLSIIRYKHGYKVVLSLNKSMQK